MTAQLHPFAKTSFFLQETKPLAPSPPLSGVYTPHRTNMILGTAPKDSGSCHIFFPTQPEKCKKSHPPKGEFLELRFCLGFRQEPMNFFPSPIPLVSILLTDLASPHRGHTLLLTRSCSLPTETTRPDSNIYKKPPIYKQRGEVPLTDLSPLPATCSEAMPGAGRGRGVTNCP